MLNINTLPKLIKRLERIPHANLKESLERVRAEEGVLLEALDKLPVGVVILEGENTFFINQYALNFLEISKSADFDTPLTKLIPDKAARAWAKETIHHPSGFCNVLNTVNSKALITSIEGEYQSGKLRQFTFLDVTQTIDGLMENYRNSKLDSISELTRSVAHEIKNPLHSMQLHLKLLQNELGELDPAKKEALEKTIGIVSEEAVRLDELTNNFLKLDPTKDRVYSETNIHEVLDSIVEMLKPEFDEKQISLLSAYDKRMPKIKIQKDKMRQCILNIIKNAIEANDKKNGKISIKTTRQGNACVITIRDDGKGIPAENLSKVFDMYYSTKSGGSGLGLAMAQEIINEHGGIIRVSSAEGKGSEFTLLLPIKQEPLELPEGGGV